MTSTLMRGKYVICKVTGPSSAEVVFDGAVLQQDGEIVEVAAGRSMKSISTMSEVSWPIRACLTTACRRPSICL